VGSGSAQAQVNLNLQPADPTTPPAYVPPGANLDSAPPEREPIVHKWWFWAAVTATVVAGVVVVMVATKEPSPPGSTLGNMNAWKGK
jgi:hypothetical protein